ncbi:DUF3828 domain-containing protein [Flavobacterium sp. Fl-318]|uniref:DUF3828 domain-containing protein n=1 Tax=Flavobacterium cupriresistens TaxID=2893885 RepID=A0ABU4RCX1_9FLAO|nr:MULTISPECIES: DUF3828 domain-containing protein [unclassified Flavobacterium]MDX6189718.1 DUF3828 domain-containing protein [Flavobacterium sp. Fl-318]UFH40876.1 YbjP/YqhG family protein [Flavobacterium sp. F-323]
MKRRHLFFIVIVLLIISCKKNDEKNKTELSSTDTKIADESNSKEILNAFYVAYLHEFTNSNLKESERKLDSLKNKYCKKTLLDSISNEFENNELDYDPFINAQDVSEKMIESLSIENVVGQKNKFQVKFHDDSSENKTNIMVTITDGKIAALK